MAAEVPFCEQSGVIAYRLGESGKPELVLVSSRNGSHWVIPKGLVESGMTPLDSAIKEAFEEAGVRVVPVDVPPVGAYLYSKWRTDFHVKVFLGRVTEVLETWPERFRKRQWLSVSAAAAKVDEPKLKDIISSVEFLIPPG